MAERPKGKGKKLMRASGSERSQKELEKMGKRVSEVNKRQGVGGRGVEKEGEEVIMTGKKEGRRSGKRVRREEGWGGKDITLKGKLKKLQVYDVANFTKCQSVHLLTVSSIKL